MAVFSSPAILLRRAVFGDFDLIVTLLTLSGGKRTVIAKNAKKSRKRFAGVLEPFSLLNVSFADTKSGGLAVLQEASLENPCAGIRGHIMKTAYASYWAEMIHLWMEEGRADPRLFYLLRDCLCLLASGDTGLEALSVFFHLRFLSVSGFSPSLSHCGNCRKIMEDIAGSRLFFELAKGQILCQECSSHCARRVSLAKGTVKQLLWVQSNDQRIAARLKFTPSGLTESLRFLEIFTVFHLGVEPKSLRFLLSLRAKDAPTPQFRTV